MKPRQYLTALALVATLNSSCSRDSIGRLNKWDETHPLKVYSSLNELIQKDDLARNSRQNLIENVKAYARELSNDSNNLNAQKYSNLEASIEAWHEYSKQRLSEQKTEIEDIVNKYKTKRIAFYTAGIVDEIITEKIDNAWKVYEVRRDIKLRQIYHDLIVKQPEKIHMTYAEFNDAITNSLDNVKPENLDEASYSEAQKHLPIHLWSRKWFEQNIMAPFVSDGEWSKDRNIRENIQMYLHNSGLIKLKENSMKDFFFKKDN